MTDDKFVTTLYHVKGKRNVRITPVNLDVKSLNQGRLSVIEVVYCSLLFLVGFIILSCCQNFVNSELG